MADHTILRDIGYRIAQRRKSLSLTQEELAERMGVSTQMISYVETGKKAIRPENLIRLCEAMNVSADYILFGRITDEHINRLSHKLDYLTLQEKYYLEEVIDKCVSFAMYSRNNSEEQRYDDNWGTEI